MELITTKFLSGATKIPSLSCIDPLIPVLFLHRPDVQSQSSSNVLGQGFSCSSIKLQCSARKLRSFGPVHSSGVGTSSTSVAKKWVLQPIGDGDSRHIGFKTEQPNAFEIASSEVIIGRVPGKADVVISVPTVSGLHARIQKAEEILLITDLDSTNGTFIGEKRLTPGVAAAALPGSIVTFGDTNLAMFRVLQLDAMEPSDEREAVAEQ